MATSRTKARITPLLFDGVIWLSQPIESYACPARSANLVGSIGHYRRQTKPPVLACCEPQQPGCKWQ